MDLLQIFTLVTGVAYIVLEIRQKNLMWVIGVLTSVTAMWVFFSKGLYASFGLNTYYLITSFIGLWHWRRDKEMVSDDAVHLNRLTWKTLAASAVLAVGGTMALAQLMNLFENPMSWLDSAVTVLSAVATWWLVRSYIQQWWLWIVADSLSVLLCAAQGMWWMALLYAAYALSAVYGYIYWRRHGAYVPDQTDASGFMKI